VFGLGFLRSVASWSSHVHFTTAMLHWYQVRGRRQPFSFCDIETGLLFGVP
jgi:hypothetical protein